MLLLLTAICNLTSGFYLNQFVGDFGLPFLGDIMANGIRVVPDTLRQIAFGTIGGAFTAIGAVFTHPIRILSIKNLTDAELYFSFDGVAIHEVLPASSALVLDFTANSSSNGRYPFLAAGTTIYTTYTVGAPTSGIAAVSAYYCAGD